MAQKPSVLDPSDLFDIRSLLSDEERMVQDTVARFTDEKVIPIIGQCFDGQFAREVLYQHAKNLRVVFLAHDVHLPLDVGLGLVKL